jgi:hypothetical protein
VIVQADSVLLDSIWVHDNAASGVWVDSARTVAMYGSLFRDNHLAGAGDTVATTVFDRFHRLWVSQTVIDNGAAAALGGYLRGIFVHFGPTGGAHAEVDSSTVLGGYAVYGLGVSRTLNDTVGMVGLRAAPAAPSRTFGADLENLGRVQVSGAVLDSADYSTVSALAAFYLGSFDVRNSQFTHVGTAVSAEASDTTGANPGPGVFTGNLVSCDTTAQSFGYTVVVSAAPVTVTGNTLQGQCFLGIVAANIGNGAPQLAATVTDNRTGTASGATSLSLQGAYLHAVVARNVSNPGAILVAGGTSSLENDSARVDSNAVHGTSTGGLRFNGPMHALTLRGNLVDSVPATASGLGGISLSSLVLAGTPVRLYGNKVSRVLRGPALSTAADTVYADSTVIVDSRLGISATGNLVGRWNFIARNDTSIYGAGFVRMDSSVIDQSVAGVRNTGAKTWQLVNNFWGDVLGPRCASGCNPASLGDSLIGPASFTPFRASAPSSTPVGVAPFRAALSATSGAVAGQAAGGAGATRAVNPSHASIKRAGTAVIPIAPRLPSRPPTIPQAPEVIW